MKQYKVTSENLNLSSPDDCYLDPSDPINEIKVLQYLGGINSEARLHEYKVNQGSNISRSEEHTSELQSH